MSKKLEMSEMKKVLYEISPNIEIIGDYIGENKTRSRKVTCLCLIEGCGHIWNPYWGHLRKGHGCPKCFYKLTSIRQSTPKLENSIYVAKPEFVKFFKDKDLCLITYPNSTKKVDMVCPDCGFEKKLSPNHLYKQGFGCGICGDGVSVPEKFIGNILSQLKLDIKREFSFKNINKRYDFYVKELNAIIEVHGIQHYKGWGQDIIDAQKQMNNDEFKKEIALSKGISEYIEIDCSLVNFSYIKNSTISSIGHIFNLENVNWEDAWNFSQKSIRFAIWDAWNNKNDEDTTTSLGKIYGYSRQGIRKCLTDGSAIGMCNYNPQEESKKQSKKAGLLRGSKVYHYDKNFNLIEEFPSVLQAMTITGKSNIRNYALGKVKPKDNTIWSLEKIIS